MSKSGVILEEDLVDFFGKSIDDEEVIAYFAEIASGGIDLKGMEQLLHCHRRHRSVVTLELPADYYRDHASKPV